MSNIEGFEAKIYFRLKGVETMCSAILDEIEAGQKLNMELLDQRLRHCDTVLRKIRNAYVLSLIRKSAEKAHDANAPSQELMKK